MYVETSIKPSSRWGMTRPKKASVMTCDSCSESFVRKYSAHFVTRGLHFCSRKCSANAGKIGGAKNIKSIVTCRKRYGVDNAQQNASVRAKTKATNLERYGNEHAIASTVVRKKIEEIFDSKYGCHPTQLKATKDKMIETRIERYGSAAPIHDNEDVSTKYHQTMRERHGVDSPLQSKEIRKKAHTTKRKNGTFNESWVERRVVRVLRAVYGDHGIEQHRRLNGWDIDMYIKQHELYVQVDGVYWHGEGGSPDAKPGTQAYAINAKRLLDSHQIEWCKCNGEKMLRLTDKELNSMSDQQIIDAVRTVA